MNCLRSIIILFFLVFFLFFSNNLTVVERDMREEDGKMISYTSVLHHFANKRKRKTELLKYTKEVNLYNLSCNYDLFPTPPRCCLNIFCPSV